MKTITLNRIKETVPAIAITLLFITSGARAQEVSIETLQFGTNTSRSPLADYLSGIPGNSANDISVGIALENLCGQIFSDETPLVPATFNVFDLCFGTVAPVLVALDPEDTEFAQFVEESAGFLIGVSGQEVASLATGFTQLTPAGAATAQNRLTKLRLAQADSPTGRALAFDSRTGELTFGLDSGGGAGDSIGTPWRFYVNGDASTGEKDTTELETGYDLDGMSLDAGGDYRLDDQRFVGFNLAATQVDLKYINGSEGDVETYDAAGYALWFRDNGWYFQGHAGLGTSNIDMSRQLRFRTRSGVFTLPDGTTFLNLLSPIETITTKFNGNTDANRVFVTVGAGRDIQRGPVTIGISSAFDFLDVDVDGYRETAEDVRGRSLELEVDDFDHQSLRLITGLDISRAISTSHGVVVPYVRGEWIHEFEDDPTSIRARLAADPFSTGFTQTNGTYLGGAPAVDPATGRPDPTTFVITSDEPDADYFQFSTGASAVFRDGLQAFVSIETVIGLRDFERYALRLGLSKEF